MYCLLHEFWGDERLPLCNPCACLWDSHTSHILIIFSNIVLQRNLTEQFPEQFRAGRNPRREEFLGRNSMWEIPGREEFFGRNTGLDESLGRNPRREEFLGRNPGWEQFHVRIPGGIFGRNPGLDDLLGRNPRRKEFLGRNPSVRRFLRGILLGRSSNATP